jgi:hypothetical protein
MLAADNIMFFLFFFCLGFERDMLAAQKQKWFDNDLDKLREKVLAQGKMYSKFPKDPVIRGHYYKLCREYNKLRKTKYRQFKAEIINKLDSLYNKMTGRSLMNIKNSRVSILILVRWYSTDYW